MSRCKEKVQLSEFTLDLARSALCTVQAFQQNRGPEHVGFLNAFRYLVWQSVYSVFVVLNSMLLLLGMFNVTVNFVKFFLAETCAVSVIRNPDERLARVALLLVEMVVLCGLLGLAWIMVYAPFFSLQYSVLRYMLVAVSVPL